MLPEARAADLARFSLVRAIMTRVGVAPKYGVVDREYGVGRGRVDLFLRWFYPAPDGTRAVQREALELKTRRLGDADPTPAGLVQLDAYLDRLGLPTGYLVIFDQRPGAADWPGDLLSTATSPSGRRVAVALVPGQPAKK